MATQILTLDQVRAMAPSAFSEGKGEKTSDKFVPVQSSKVLETLVDLGWQATAAQQRKARTPDGQAYCRHMIRMRQEGFLSAYTGFLTTILIYDKIRLVTSEMGLYEGLLQKQGGPGC